MIFVSLTLIKKIKTIKHDLFNYFLKTKEAVILIWTKEKLIVLCFLASALVNPVFSFCSTLLPAKFLGNLSSFKLEKLTLNTFFSVCFPAILFFFLDAVVFSLCFMFLQRVEKKADARLELFGHKQSASIMNKLDNKHFDNPKTYDIIKNGRLYDFNIAKSIVKRPFLIIGDVVTYIGYVILLLPLGWEILIILTSAIILTNFLTIKIEKYKDKIKRKSALEGRRYSFFLELLKEKNNLQEIRIYGIFTALKSKLNQSHKIMSDYALQEARYICSYSLVGYLLSAIPAWICLVYVIIQTHLGTITIEDFFVISAAIENYVAYTHNFLGMFSKMSRESLMLEHHKEFCEIENTIVDGVKKEFPDTIHQIEAQNIELWYHESDKCVLSDVSFIIPRGSLVSIVGPNGSGKSSLVKLLTRLYDPSRGTMLVNGKDLRNIDALAWYDSQSILFQDYHLFALTIEENICFSNIDKRRLSEVMQNSQSSDLICNLPNSTETECGKEFSEKGVDFSGGESQRICLARAFYKKSDVWILDEPSAAIDPISEAAIFDYLYSQRGQKTIFVVSHKLSIAKKSDIILVLNDGQLIEKGTHLELMKKNGVYKELFNSQAERYI